MPRITTKQTNFQRSTVDLDISGSLSSAIILSGSLDIHLVSGSNVQQVVIQNLQQD